MGWPLRRVFRLTWWALCSLTLLALPLLVFEFSRLGYNIHYQGWFIGGIFVILSFPISVYAVALHTEYYTKPHLQRYIIRILWMVPIYGVDAWLALRFRPARKYLDPVRECYEAFVIYSFYAYLMAYLDETVGDLAGHLAKKPPMQHLPVVRWVLPRWQMGQEFLFECKKGVLNYVIMRPLCTCIGLITDIFGLYGQGKIDFGKSYIYLAAATNFSQVWALYCLAMMYHKMHAELAPIRPLSKFLVVKAVVFVTFWQGVLLAILVYNGFISNEDWTLDDQHNVAAGIQDFLICIEMFFAALAHAYAFPPRDYMDPCEPRQGFLKNVRHMFDLSDVVEDVSEVVENHATTTSSTVWKLPKTAAKAARHMPNNILSLLTGGECAIYGFPGKKKAARSPPAGGNGEQYALLLQDEQDGSHGRRRAQLLRQEQWQEEGQEQGQVAVPIDVQGSALERPLIGLNDPSGPGTAYSPGSTPPTDGLYGPAGAGAGAGGGALSSLAARLFRTRGVCDDLAVAASGASGEWREMSEQQRGGMKVQGAIAMNKSGSEGSLLWPPAPNRGPGQGPSSLGRGGGLLGR